jgi:hypothetical protein
MMIQEKFEKFHSDNPHIFSILEGMASRWLSIHSQVGMKMLWEVLRWQLGVEVSNTGEYRLNNNYTSRYARLLLEKHPEWAGRIQLRALQSA